METHRLKQFCVIAQTENLRKAAGLLGISHGGLFKSMKVLEEELGFELFNREGRGIVLSDKGKDFYPKAVNFLKQFEELLTDSVQSNKNIRIGTFEVFSTYFFSGPLLNEFQEEGFVLKEFLPGELENEILSNSVDIGITYEPIPTQGIDILKIGTCNMAIYGLKNCFKNFEFEEIPFVAPVTNINTPITGVKGLDGWPDDKFKRNIKYRVDMLETAIQICSEGKAIGFFPEFVVNLYNKKVANKYKLEIFQNPKGFKKIKRDIFIIKRRSFSENRDIKRISKTIRTIIE